MIKKSKVGLNAVNFFIAEVGIILPFLANYLKENHWNYNQIGLALAFGGLGSFFFQIFAGVIVDRVRNKKNLLVFSSITFGLTYLLVTQCPTQVALVTFLIFLTGVWGTFFIPLLGAIALSLSKKNSYEKLIATNRSWFHIGNLTVASLSLILIDYYGIFSVFILITSISILAAITTVMISNKDLCIQKKEKKFVMPDFMQMIHDTKNILTNKTVIILFLFVSIFNAINAPMMPMVGLYLNKIVGEYGNRFISLILIVTQALMVVVATVTGKYGQRYGRKFLLGIAFFAISLRALLCSIIVNPYGLATIQILDSITAGIYGIVICLICNDLTQGKKGFSTLLATTQTALALGGIVGPLIQGLLTTYFGFKFTFFLFFLITLIAFFFYIIKMPETNTDLKSTLPSFLKRSRLKILGG